MHRSSLLSCLVFVTTTIGIYGNTDCGCRLPDAIIPQHYNLEIITHLEDNKFNYEGRVEIKVRCLQPTKTIVLHSLDLTIEEPSVKVEDLTNQNITKVGSISYDTENHFLKINTVDNLKENHDYIISMLFFGKLKDSLDGYYRSSYNKNNEKKWLAVTQFEPTDARQAFPCFDEPAMKAIFKISLGRLNNYTSISNMPIASTVPMEGKPGWFWDHFEETVPMSTYLVAFAITDFEFVSSSTKHGTTFRVWARSEALNQVGLANSTGPLALEYFEDFFNISYPLPKQDMIALPDFGAGAMENWGLITFRESSLLYDPASSSISHKTAIADVISHELAHQWFGNLVTMKWWTDLWLNEGFATYMASKAVEHIYPEWNYFTQESISRLQGVLLKDSLKTSHPVSVPVGNPDEISEIFDAISYDKGALLLHMMANFLGPETFRLGVSKYLRINKYNNAEQDDLWEALTIQAHEDNVLPKNLTVKTIMDTWTLQTGYPVVTVTRDYERNCATLTQERFLRDAIKTRITPSCWWVPITYTTEKTLNFKESRPDTWLSCPSGSNDNNNVIEGLPGSNEWIIFNLQATGLYRVNYDQKNWDLLTSTLNSDLHNKIPSISKVQLIDDSANLAWVGDIKYSIHFDVLQYLKYERGYLPWRAALSSVDILNKMLKRTSVYGLFKKYMKELLTPIYNQVGGFKFPDKVENNLEKIEHQVQITSWSCKFGVGNCVDEAIKLFEEWHTSRKQNSIPKDIKSTVYCNAIRHGGEREWNLLWQHYHKSDSAIEKNVILHALGCTNEIWLLQRYLEWAISSTSGIRLQDCTSVIQAVARNNVGYYVARNFIQMRIKDISNYLSTSSKKLGRVFYALTNQMTNEHEYNEFKQFTETNKQYLLENVQAIKQGLETAELQIQWHSKHYEEIKKLLPEYLK